MDYHFWLTVLSEFLGTMVLIILGNGVNYSVSGRKMFANQPGKWTVIIFGWGIAVMAGVLVSRSLGGFGHLNPAVSIYGAISNKDATLLIYIPFQLLGAMVGQIVLDFINWKHIQETELSTIRSSHCTGPAYDNKKDKALIFNFSYELVGTLMLVGVILAFNRGAAAKDVASLGPLPVTWLVVGIGASIGASTGYAINPARDFGPRIIYWFLESIMLKKRKSEHIGANWKYSWLPVVAPSLAGAIIGLFALIH
ncbi:MIP/aquaporin family protein [Mycoplasma sp. AC1221]